MSEEPKKWKRGDIGPDGRVFVRMKRGKPYFTTLKTLENIIKKERQTAKCRNEKYRKSNQSATAASTRNYRRKNRGKVSQWEKRFKAKASFKKQDGSSLEAWTASLKYPMRTAGLIDSLTPDPGQTLAELIHELSGYPMEVCEQIANPPDLTPEKLDNPPTPDTLAGGPDLF